MIHVRNLRKEFTVHRKPPGLMGSLKSLFKRDTITKVAVKDVSFDVNKGEILGLIGANGAGKTTIVKMLSGIIHPTSGSIDVLGFNPWQRHHDFCKQIALIMGQKAQLWWDLPAADGFLLLREIYQVPPKEHQEMLDFLLDVLDVRDEVNIQIRRLSLGERMKMELIAALLHKPQVVYLDEPTIGLDLSAQRAIRKFILEYRDTVQPAMILTSHYMEDIEQLCKRVVILLNGQFVFDGPLLDVVKIFSTHKIITLKLHQPGPFPQLGPGLDLIEDNGDELKFKVMAEEVGAVSQHLLSKISGADLSVGEVNVSDVIESLFQDSL
jgi:ABC-2 type transport system ATP-binding protein